MLILNSNKAAYGFRIPQSYSEVTADLLKTYVKNVKLAPHYSILAICRKTRLFDLAMLDNKANRPIISAKTFLAKFNEKELSEYFENPQVKDSVIITRSSLELGTQLATACPLSEEKIAGYLRNKAHGDELLKEASRGAVLGDNGTDEIILVSFKIVGNNSIAAIIPQDSKEQNPVMFSNAKSAE